MFLLEIILSLAVNIHYLVCLSPVLFNVQPIATALDLSSGMGDNHRCGTFGEH